MTTKRCPIFRHKKWHSYPGGDYAPISRSAALRVLAKAKGHDVRRHGMSAGPYPLPRPGHYVVLCTGMKVINRGGRFELDRSAEVYYRRRRR